MGTDDYTRLAGLGDFEGCHWMRGITRWGNLDGESVKSKIGIATFNVKMRERGYDGGRY